MCKAKVLKRKTFKKGAPPNKNCLRGIGKTKRDTAVQVTRRIKKIRD